MSLTQIILQIIDLILDNLFIFLIIGSFLLPLFRNGNKKRKDSMPPQNRTPRAQRQAEQDANRRGPQDQRPQSQTITFEKKASTGLPNSGNSDFEKKLEEARRRVQDAMGDSSSSSMPSSPPSVTQMRNAAKPSPATSGRLVPSDTIEAHPLLGDSGSSGSLVSSDKLEAHPLLGDSSPADRPPMVSAYDNYTRPVSTAAPSFNNEQAPLKVAKLSKSSSSMVNKDLLNFNKQSILNGFVWHYILSDPKAKARRKA